MYKNQRKIYTSLFCIYLMDMDMDTAGVENHKPSRKLAEEHSYEVSELSTFNAGPQPGSRCTEPAW